MLIDQFAEITRAIIEDDGFEGFLPTLLLPQQNKVVVLDDLPADAAVEPIAVDWAGATAGLDQDYLLAFKLDASHFKVIARLDGERQEGLYRV
jgi:hypothetical protein